MFRYGSTFEAIPGWSDIATNRSLDGRTSQRWFPTSINWRAPGDDARKSRASECHMLAPIPRKATSGSFPTLRHLGSIKPLKMTPTWLKVTPCCSPYRGSQLNPEWGKFAANGELQGCPKCRVSPHMWSRCSHRLPHTGQWTQIGSHTLLFFYLKLPWSLQPAVNLALKFSSTPTNSTYVGTIPPKLLKHCTHLYYVCLDIELS